MKRGVVSLAALSLLAISAASYAGPKGFYWGAKGGILDPDAAETDEGLNVGGYVGYTLPWLSGLAVEGEATITAIKSEANSRKLEVQTIAAYGVWRSKGPIFFKGKLGVLRERVEAGTATETDEGVSFGLGVGFPGPGKHEFEIEYTILENDLNFLSVGFTFK